MKTSRSHRAEEDWLRAGAAALARMASTSIKMPTAESVMYEAGKSRNSFNAFWKSRGGKEGFDTSLARYLARRERFDELPEIASLLADMAGAVDLAAALREFCKLDFELVLRSEANTSVMALYAGVGDQTVRSLLRRVYNQIDEYLVGTIGLLLAERRLELCWPFTLNRFVVVVNQLCDGLTFRARFDEECVDAELYADALLALLLGATRRVGAGGTITGRFNDELGNPG